MAKSESTQSQPVHDSSEPPPSRFKASEGQHGIWAEYCEDPEGTSHNVVAVVRVDPAIDPAVFEASVRTLAARHPMLRAQFEATQASLDVVTGATEPDCTARDMTETSDSFR